MSRVLGVLGVLAVVLLAMGFAAANAGHRVTLSLGLITIYRAPVTLVAFGGLFLGMVVMFATGIHADLKVRRVLRERLAQEVRQEQTWIDRSQRDLFSPEPEGEGKRGGEGPADPSREPQPPTIAEASPE